MRNENLAGARARRREEIRDSGDFLLSRQDPLWTCTAIRDVSESGSTFIFARDALISSDRVNPQVENHSPEQSVRLIDRMSPGIDKQAQARLIL